MGCSGGNKLNAAENTFFFVMVVSGAAVIVSVVSSCCVVLASMQSKQGYMLHIVEQYITNQTSFLFFD